MANNPTLLTQPIAANGAKNVIPNTTSTAGAMSQDQGFPAETALPLGAGGVAPTREDFNGVFNLLGGIAFYAQKGYTWEWDSSQDYVVGCIVIDPNDSKRYECIADVTANATSPSADTTHWKEFGTDTAVLANTDLSNLTATGLNAFATKTLSNLDTANLACHLVVDSYYNSSTGDWYRVYDDGWVEQGGEVATTDNQTVTVNLFKAMANDKYMVLTSRRKAEGGAYLPCVKTRTTTTITILGYDAYSIWYVAGMGANS